jgi:hypothetical protein
MSLDLLQRFWKALVLVGLCAAPGVLPRANAAAITNVTVANVTPSSFTLVWSMEGTPSVDVFADAGGTSNLVGVAGLEWDPVHTGNAGLTEEAIRRQQRASLSARARSLGLGHVRISRLKPGTTYYFRISARLANNSTQTYPAAGLASVTTPPGNSFVTEAQQLVIDIPGLDNDGHILTLTHSNAAFALSAVVGDGAGTNQAFFNVADLLALGGQTNFTANGSQEFSVDFRGANDSHTRQPFTLVFDGAFSIAEAAYNAFGIEFSALTLGSTITRAGSTGAVAITFNSSVPIREITAQLNVPTALLRGLMLSNLPPSVATATVISNTPNTALVHVVMQTGQTLQGALPFGQLWFTAISNQPSAFLPLRLTGTVLGKADGSSVSNVLVQPGRVVLVAEQPLLEAFAAGNGTRSMTIYGKPWSAYALEYSTDLKNANGWRVHSRHPFTGMFVNISGMHGNSGTYFYRAAELRSDPPALESLVGTNNTRRLLVFGQPGGQYTLQSATNLSGVVTWSPVLSYTLSNSFTYLGSLGTNTANTFYRLRRD